MKPTFETSGLSLEDWDIIKDHLLDNRYLWRSGSLTQIHLKKIFPFHISNYYGLASDNRTWCYEEIYGVWANIWIHGSMKREFIFTLESDAIMFKLRFG
jgi:hypothetical protein